MTKPIEYGDLEFTRPAKQIKAVNLPDVPQRIFDGMKQYEDAARGALQLSSSKDFDIYISFASIT